MVNFSLATVYTTILTSNLLLIIIACIMRSEKFLFRVGYKLLTIISLFTLLRLLLPLEFPFTVTRVLPKYISFVIFYIRHPFVTLMELPISSWTILLLIWLLGIIINLFTFYKQLVAVNNYITTYGIDITAKEQYSYILNKICTTPNIKKRIRVILLKDINSPMLYGLISPMILLPDTMTLSEEELYYIFNHEIAHYQHHDILLKYIIKGVSIIYWWNPACYFLSKETDMLLEMNVDASVAANPKTAAQYLRCLLHIAELSQTETSFYSPLPIGFCQDEKGTLTKRFQMLINKSKKKNAVVNTLIFMTTLFVYFFSYMFIYEAGYVPPQIEEAYFTPSADDSYFIQNEDGTYDFYLWDTFMETLDSLDGYSKDIPIYKNITEVPTYEKEN